MNGDEWQELFKTETAHNDWTKQVLYLPENAKKANVEIGFKSVNHDGNGIYLDDVSVEIVSSIQSYAVTYNANGGSGTMTDANSPYLETMATVLPNGFTAPNHTYFNSWNTKADGSGAKYYPGDDFEVTGNVTLYAQWKDAASGLNEDFEGRTALPCGWTVVADDDGKQWYVYKTNTENNIIHSGVQAAVMSYGTSWLISPSLDLRGTDNSWILSFWYRNVAINDLET